MKNTIKAMLVLMLALVSVTFVSAASFSIDRVDVNGITATGNLNNVELHRGQVVPITVWLSGNADVNDVRVKAYLSGYEYDEVEVVSDIFRVAENGAYIKHLTLRLPNDMSSSKLYDLHVVATSSNEEVRESFKVSVEEDRHLLNVYDVIMNPFNNVQAGQPLFVTVRVENMGAHVEDSIKATVSIPELGVQTSEFVDQLVIGTDDQYDETFYVTKRDATTTNELMLNIPEDAKEGDYQVHVTLNYNRGHGALAQAEQIGDEKVYTLHVQGAKAQVVVNNVNALVNVDSSNQRATAGQGAVYKVSVANLGREAQAFTVEALGVSNWGISRVDPQSVIVGADKTGEAFVYVSPSESTQAGLKTFTVLVKDQAGNVVAQKALTLDVAGAAVTTVSDFGTLKQVLQVAFVVLLAILIILGIVLVAKRLGGRDESAEGQTYYQ